MHIPKAFGIPSNGKPKIELNRKIRPQLLMNILL